MSRPDPALSTSEPSYDCALCSRLADFHIENREKYPDFHNGPVKAFSASEPVRLLIVGLAPGLKGANATGRPFTGDYAGDLLYETLLRYGFASGTYGGRADDGLALKAARITNAVRCVPPQNKPTTAEIRTCNGFLAQELAGLSNLRVILALGTIAHGAILTALGMKKSACAFGHGAEHRLAFQGRAITLVDSYHCSRYNTQTRRLTPEMFRSVFERLREISSDEG
ncbi:MAG: uracil-DNA glycosylase [Magnetovibrionaceae bacterium]